MPGPFSGLIDTIAGISGSFFPKSKTAPESESGPSVPDQAMGGDDQSVDQSGRNENEQNNNASAEQRDEIFGQGGGTTADAGRNVSTTTISPVVTPSTKVAVEGQSQASAQANANAAVQGQEHQQVQAHNEVQAAQQNIAVPLTVDMSKSASASTTQNPLLAVAAVIVGLGAVLALRQPRERRAPRGGGRRAR